MSKKTRLLLAIIVAVGLSYIVSQFYFQMMVVIGDSMHPTFRKYQIVLLDKQSKDYIAGDVIAFRSETLDGVIVKRIVGCPGDKVEIKEGVLLVNDNPSPFYANQVFEYEGLLKTSLKLGEQQFIVIGDNISESKDSRYDEVGIVSLSDILGKVIQFR